MSEGVHGETNAVRWVGAVTGVALNPDGNCPGVWGQSNGYGPGVFGQSNKDAGVTGFHGDPRLQENPVAASEGGRAGVFGASDVGAGVLGYSASNASAAVVAYGGLRASALTYPFAGEFFGNVVVNGDIFLPDADCAEHFEIAGVEEFEPGTVMVIDSHGALTQSYEAYDKRAAGVISGAGKFKQGGAIGYRGVVYYQTASQKFARLNGIAAVFEYDVDGQGNTSSKIWEWK